MTQTITVKMDKDSEYYFVDASATDQGAADASYDSAKDLIDAIGASKSATLVFSHSGGGNTTTYTFSTSETIPDNFDVIVEKGAIITIATGITVTCGASFNAGLYKCFSLAGTGKWSFSDNTVREVFAEWWGAEGDGTTDDHAAIDDALASITNGTLRLLGGTYYIGTSDVVLSGTGKHVVGSGMDSTTILIALAGGSTIMFGDSTIAKFCSVRDLTVDRAAGTPDGSTIGVHGYNFFSCYLENVRVRRSIYCLYFTSIAGFSDESNGFRVERCHIEECNSSYVYLDDAKSVSIVNCIFGTLAPGTAEVLTADYFFRFVAGPPIGVIVSNCHFLVAAGTAEYTGTCTDLRVRDNIGFREDILASKTYNAPSISAASYAAVAWTDITGAALGDFVDVSLGVDVVDLVIDARVTATDTISMALYNNTAGAIDLASTTVYIRVRKGNI